MPRALGITITAVIVTILRSYVSAQTQADCPSGYSTSLYNSLGQSPCTMAIDLGGVCTGFFYVPPLAQPPAPYRFYTGPPTQSEANSCACSTVIYSLLSACAICQEGQIIPWPNYAVNCPTGLISMSSFSKPIPSNTKIPHWAYQDVVANVNQMFDPVEAEMVGGLESSALPPPASSTQATSTSTQATVSSTQATASSTQMPTSSTQMPTSSTRTTGSSTESAPVSSTSGNPKSKPNVGAIAGGVIGGVFLGIVAGLVTFIILRRRKPSDPSPFTSNSAASPETVMSYKNPGSDGPYGS